ncbi:7-cyano-7-deazaguanine synthase [Chloroflexota bacterium]
MKGKYEYDAIVGLSGGKDSTYVLCQILKEYNLKVLAVTYDNGFLTDSTRESIKNTVQNLGVDHYYHKPNWDTHRKLYKATVTKLGDPCIACAIGGYFLAIKGCYERKIPFFIHGRTPFQMYMNFYENSNDVFLKLMNLNLAEHSFTEMSKVYNPVNEYVKESIISLADTRQDAKEIADEFFVDSSELTQEFTPEFLAYFLFEQYDEEMIKNWLEHTIGWVKPVDDALLGHFDCEIHHAAEHMFREINDVDMLEAELATMVRFGAMGKEEAGKFIALHKPTANDIESSLDSLCAACGINREDLKNSLYALKRAGVSRFGAW